MPPFPVSELLVMSWSSGSPRDSSLFTSWGVLYRFETALERKKTVTTIWRAISETKQERVARFEWNADGDLGRALIGRSSIPMADLVRRHGPASSRWTGPDGLEYTWTQSTTTPGEILLYDPSGVIIALYRKVAPRRWDIGEVVTTDGELHFFSNAGSRTVTHPPMMDLVVLSIMLHRMVIR